MPIPDDLAAAIRDRIRAFAADPANPAELREAAAALDLLPLRPRGDRHLGLLPDGQVVSFAPRPPHDPRPLPDRSDRAAALRPAARLDPALAPLVPPPPLSARACPRCFGSGFILIGTDPTPVLCVCDGVGWLAPIDDPFDERGRLIPTIAPPEVPEGPDRGNV